MIEQFTEFHFWCLSSFPPTFLALSILHLMSWDPKPLVKSLAPLVPGMSPPKFRPDGSVYLVLNTKAEWWEEHMHMAKKSLRNSKYSNLPKFNNKNLRQSLARLPMFGSLARHSVKEEEPEQRR